MKFIYQFSKAAGLMLLILALLRGGVGTLVDMIRAYAVLGSRGVSDRPDIAMQALMECFTNHWLAYVFALCGVSIMIIAKFLGRDRQPSSTSPAQPPQPTSARGDAAAGRG